MRSEKIKRIEKKEYDANTCIQHNKNWRLARTYHYARLKAPAHFKTGDQRGKPCTAKRNTCYHIRRPMNTQVYAGKSNTTHERRSQCRNGNTNRNAVGRAKKKIG